MEVVVVRVVVVRVVVVGIVVVGVVMVGREVAVVVVVGVVVVMVKVSGCSRVRHIGVLKLRQWICTHWFSVSVVAVKV